MSKVQIYDWDTTGTSITDEYYGSVGSETFQLGTAKRAFKGGANLVIRTGAGGAGTLLTEDTDYTVENQDTDFSSVAGFTVYTGIKITNASYQATTLYISYVVIGSYIESSAISRTGLYQNGLRNSNFNEWNRGISFSATGYVADGWYVSMVGGSPTFTRQSFTVGQTDVPNNPTYYGQLTLDGSQADPNLYNSVESVSTYAGETVTFSFWAKCNTSSDMENIYIGQIFGSGGSAAVYTDIKGSSDVSLTTSWKQFKYSYTVPSISGKTIGADNYVQFRIDFESSTALTIDIAQAQVNIGSSVLDYQPLQKSDELSLCQRFFESFQPAQLYNRFGVGFVTAATTATIVLFMKVTKRSTTMTLATNGSLEIYDSGGGHAVTSISIDTNGTNANILTLSVTCSGGGLTAGNGCMLIASNDATAYITVDADF